MKKFEHKLNLLILLAVVFTIAVGCGGNQVEEANKLVAEANKSIDEAAELMTQTEKKYADLFDENIQNVQQFSIYRNKKFSESKDIIDDYSKVMDNANVAVKKYSEAGKLNLPEKYKEYLDIKAKEYALRAEAITFRKTDIQTFRETTTPSELAKVFEVNREKFKNKLKDAKELGDKAEKIKTENKELFKS